MFCITVDDWIQFICYMLMYQQIFLSGNFYEIKEKSGGVGMAVGVGKKHVATRRKSNMNEYPLSFVRICLSTSPIYM